MKKRVIFLFFVVSIFLLQAEVITKSGDVSGEVWGSDTYYVVSSVSVTAGDSLVIEPGAIVKFVTNSELLVYGKLLAHGIESSYIVFTSVNDDSSGETIEGSTGNPNDGSWRGININGNGYREGIGEFDYCDVRYGGENSQLSGNIQFSYSDYGYFNNSVSQNCETSGIRGYSSSIEITNSSFENNGEFPVNLGNCTIDNISGNSGSSNGYDIFSISGTLSGSMELSENVIGFPCLINNTLTVNTDDSLTIPEGEVIKFTEDGNISVNGYLYALGTEAEQIVFTSFKDDSAGGDWNNDEDATIPAAGDWKGINLNGYYSDQGLGEFDWCNISYGGRSNTYGIYYSHSDSGYVHNSVIENCNYTGIFAQYSYQIDIDNCIVQNNGFYGIYPNRASMDINNCQINNNLDNGIRGHVADISITGCQINNNANYAVELTSGGILDDISGNNGSGNNYNVFSISGTAGGNLLIDSSVVGFPCVINNQLQVNASDTLSIAAGEIIKFQNTGSLYVYGLLDINGTSEEECVLTSFVDDSYGGDWNNDGDNTIPEAGDWKGVYLNGQGDSRGIGEIENCIIRYGGENSQANIVFDRSDFGYFLNSISEFSSNNGFYAYSASPQIQSSSFGNNSLSGVYCYSNCSAYVDNCEFNANGEWAIRMNSCYLNEYHNNTGSGNFYDMISISGTFAGNTELTAAISGFPFVVSAGVSLNNPDTLTVPAGEIVKFLNSSSMTIYGRLNVNGIEEDEVVFTSFYDDSYGGDWNNDGDLTVAEPGLWHGIQLNGNGANQGIGEFDHCRVRYGGAGNYANGNIEYYYSDTGYFRNSVSEFSQSQGIYPYGCNNIEINNSQFYNNNLDGVWSRNSTTSIDNCVFSDNQRSAAGFHNCTILNYTGNSGNGNFYNQFAINGGNSGASNLELSESQCGFPFRIESVLTIDNGDTLYIPAGETMKFTSGSGLTVYGDIYAVGEEGSEIVFTSFFDDEYDGDWNSDGEETISAAGDWQGIHVNGSGANRGIGEFDYCRIRYGGSGNYDDANLEFYASDTGYFHNSYSEFSANQGLYSRYLDIDIFGSIFSNNGLDGIWCRDCTPQVNNCGFNENGRYAAGFYDCGIEQYSGNYGSGNNYDCFSLRGNTSGNLELSHTLYGFPMVIINSFNVINGDTLSIPAGEIIKFADDAYLNVYGKIEVTGEAGEDVVFTSFKDDLYGGDWNNDGDETMPAAGDWGEIKIAGNSSNQGVGEFDHAHVRYGGGSSAVNFYYAENGWFEHGKVENSFLVGLGVNYCSIPVNNSEFNNNGTFPVKLYNSIIQASSGNFGSGNLYSAFAISGNCPEVLELSSEECGFPFWINTSLQVPNSCDLTIAEGTLMKFNDGAELNVYGAIHVNGTEEDPVVFTSVYDDEFGGDTNGDGSLTSPAPGNWDGINIDGNSSNLGYAEIAHSRIRYGGNISGASDSNIRFNSSASGYMHNSIIEFSSTSGSLVRYSSPEFFGNTFENNADAGVYIYGSSSQPDLGSEEQMGMNSFINNDDGEFQLVNSSANTISALYNIWGYTSADSIDAHISDDNECDTCGEVMFDPWFTVNNQIVLTTDNPMDFGEVYTDETLEMPVTVWNYGEEEITLTNLYLSSNPRNIWGFTYEDLPAVLSPGEESSIMISFAPDSAWAYSDTLHIINSSINQPHIAVSLSGMGVLPPDNHPPEINLPESFTYEENGSIEIDFTPYITDIDGDSLIITRSGGYHISVAIDEYLVTIGTAGNWNGTENVIFTVDDQQTRATASDTVAIIVTPVNDPPVITLPPSFTFSENESLTVNFNPYIFDVDGDQLTLSFAGNQNIQVAMDEYFVTFTAIENWYGSELITFFVDDGQQRVTASDVVEVIVTPTNLPPIIVLPDNFSTLEDTDLEVDFSQYVSDPNQDNLSLYADGNVNINVYIQELMVTFHPHQDWFGSEIIYFTVNDNQSRDTASDSVLVIVTPVNDPPVINLPYSFSFEEDSSLQIDFAEYISDVENDTLLLTVDDAEFISVELSEFLVTFSAEPDWNGSEAITFYVNDEIQRLSDEDQVLIEVIPRNDPPVIDLPESFSFNEDGVYFTDLSEYYFDIDGDELELSCTGNEILSVNINEYMVYISAVENWNGSELLYFTVDDNQSRDTATDSVLVIVNPVNDPPFIELPDNFTIQSGEELEVDFTQYVFDVDEDPLILAVSGNSNVGVEILDLIVTFSSDPEWTGSEILTFMVDDASGRPAYSDDVEVIVTPIELLADFEADLTEAEAMQQIQFTDLTTGNAVTWAWDFENDGTIDSDEQNPVWAYDEAGIYTVSLTVTNESRETSTEVKTDYITVTEPSFIFDLPVSVTFNEDESTSLDLEQYISGGNPQNMTAMWSGNTNVLIDVTGMILEFSAEPNWNGSEQITITIDDGAQTESDDIIVIVEPVNDLPDIDLPDQFTFPEDGILNVDFAEYVHDVEGDLLTVTVMNNSEIIVNITDLQVEFTSSANWYGTEILTFIVNDNMAARPSDIVEVIVTPVNDAPVIILPDTFTFVENSQLTVDFSSYVYDVDNVNLTITSEGQQNISVEISDYLVTFSTMQAWNGSEIITFIVNDGVERLIATDDVEVIVTADPQGDSYAADFDGTSDYMICEGFDYPQSDFTMEAWVLPESISGTHEMIYGLNHDNFTSMQFRVNQDGSIIFGENPSWTYIMTDSDVLILNEWNHVAVSRTDGFCRLIVNGIERAQGEVMQNVDPTSLYIGGRGSGNDRFFDGLIDDVRIWSYGKSTEEIMSLMHTELNGEEDNLLAYWNMNEGTGQMAEDISGNGYNMQLGSTDDIDDNDPAWQSTNWAYPIPLFAYFACDTNYGYAPLDVQFWGLSNPDATIWEWDFQNDGIIDSYLQNPSFTYNDPGTYSVTISVSDGTNIASYTRQDYINVIETSHPEPVDFSVNELGHAVWNNPPARELLGYNVFIDGEFLDFTTNTFYLYADLNYQQSYIAGVSAVYDTGESEVVETVFTYLAQPGEFACEFDGQNTYINCGNDQSLNLSDQLTLEAWIYPTGWGEVEAIGFGRILDKKNYKIFVLGEGSAIGYNDQCLGFATNCVDGSYVTYTPSNSIELNTWQHIAVTYDSSGITHLYINGIDQQTGGDLSSGLLADSSEYDLLIGEADSFQRAYQGAIEELRVWNMVRSHAEILGSMHNELTGTEEGLVAYWQFNMGEGQFALDITDNDNHGRHGDNVYEDASDPQWIASDFPFEMLTADFTADILSGIYPLEVQFEDLSTGTIILREWDFDNNGTIDSYDTNPVWTYTEPGIYSVTLTVLDEESNTHTEIKENYISVKPDWAINPPDYEYSCVFWGIVFVDEVQVESTDGLLGCFVDDECRGLATSDNNSIMDYTDIPEIGHVAFMPMVYSNLTEGDIITFKYWDPETGSILNVLESQEFVADMFFGNGTDPYSFHATTAQTAMIDLNAGWNWFSINLEAPDMGINTVLGSIEGSAENIKGQSAFATYYPGPGWLGSLAEISPMKMYMLSMLNQDVLEFSGTLLDVENTEYNIVAGWNWISYLPQQAQEINYALTELGENGSFIKNQTSFSSYYPGAGWLGSLDTLLPYDGYKIEANDLCMFHWLENAPARSQNAFINASKEQNSSQKFNPFKFMNNGVMVISSDDNISETSHIFAYCGDELRGISEFMDYSDITGRKYHGLMIYSNEDMEEDFQLFYQKDSKSEMISLDYEFAFVNDMTKGDFKEPLLINLQHLDEDVPQYSKQVSIYPNPFNPQTIISFEIPEESTVSINIYNLKGQLVKQLVNDKFPEGKFNITWNAAHNTSGIYLVKYKSSFASSTKKIVLLK